MSLVLDASAVLSWILTRPTEAEVERSHRLLNSIPGQALWVPALWNTEVANALLVAERRQVLQRSKVIDFLHRLDQLPIRLDEDPPQLHRSEVMVLARGHGLSAYDATYLELSLRTSSQLASFDRRLNEATQQAGGLVFQ